MAYCILSIKKLKTNDDILKSYEHAKNCTQLNKEDRHNEEPDSIATAVKNDDILGAWETRFSQLPYYRNHTFRKDGVKAYSIRISYSKEASSFLNISRWKNKVHEWLSKTFKNENIINLVFHSANIPEYGRIYHAHAIVIPVDAKGAINASFYTKKKKDYIKLQDSFAESMKPLGLERGLRYNTGNQLPPKDYYQVLTDPVYGIHLPKQNIGETAAEYNERLIEAWKGERAAHVREMDDTRQKLNEASVNLRTEKELDHLINKRNKGIRAILEERKKSMELIGEEETARGLAGAMKELKYGLDNYPDRFYAETARKDIIRILEETCHHTVLYE